MNILIIEPNRILAKNYVTFFKKTFKNVYLACDADQAVAMADKLSIDIVLSEIFYLKHNVLEFLYEFRSYQRLGLTLKTLCLLVNTDQTDQHRNAYCLN